MVNYSTRKGEDKVRQYGNLRDILRGEMSKVELYDFALDDCSRKTEDIRLEAFSTPLGRMIAKGKLDQMHYAQHEVSPGQRMVNDLANGTLQELLDQVRKATQWSLYCMAQGGRVNQGGLHGGQQGGGGIGDVYTHSPHLSDAVMIGLFDICDEFKPTKTRQTTLLEQAQRKMESKRLNEDLGRETL